MTIVYVSNCVDMHLELRQKTSISNKHAIRHVYDGPVWLPKSMFQEIYNRRGATRSECLPDDLTVYLPTDAEIKYDKARELDEQFWIYCSVQTAKDIGLKYREVSRDSGNVARILKLPKAKTPETGLCWIELDTTKWRLFSGITCFAGASAHPHEFDVSWKLFEYEETQK